MSTARRLDPAHVVVEQGLKAAKETECVVIVDEEFEAEVRFANNTTTTNGQRRNRSVTVIAIVDSERGRSVGIASKSGPVDIAALVEAAKCEAKEAPPAEDAMPVVGQGADQDARFSDDPEQTDLSVLSEVIAALPDAFGAARADATTLAGFARHAMATTYLGTSQGIRRRHVQPDGTFELVGRDATRSAWASAGTEDYRDVSLADLAVRVAQRLEWAKHKIDLPAGRYEALLPSDAVADLMVPLVEAMSGRDAEDGQNVFAKPGGATRIGERCSTLPFSLVSDPRLPGLQGAPFVVAHSSGTDLSVFDNGCPIECREWIANGTIERLGYHRAGAQRSQALFTPPAENLLLEADGWDATMEELIASTERALLLTCLWYIREVDPTTLLLTGLTRDGVYLVEDGEVVGAVNNFRFNESPLDVLRKATEAGGPTRGLSREWNEWMSQTAMSPLRVADFNMSSVSPAS